MIEQPPSNAVLLTIGEAASELRCSISTLYREIADGNLPYHKVRGKRLIHRVDLASYLNKSRTVNRTDSPVLTYTDSKRRLSAAARELMGDDDFEVKPRPKKRPK